jgi:hypothetical protein
VERRRKQQKNHPAAAASETTQKRHRLYHRRALRPCPDTFECSDQFSAESNKYRAESKGNAAETIALASEWASAKQQRIRQRIKKKETKESVIFKKKNERGVKRKHSGQAE